MSRRILGLTKQHRRIIIIISITYYVYSESYCNSEQLDCYNNKDLAMLEIKGPPTPPPPPPPAPIPPYQAHTPSSQQTNCLLHVSLTSHALRHVDFLQKHTKKNSSLLQIPHAGHCIILYLPRLKLSTGQICIHTHVCSNKKIRSKIARHTNLILTQHPVELK